MYIENKSEKQERFYHFFQSQKNDNTSCDGQRGTGWLDQNNTAFTSMAAIPNPVT